ncbi:MAG: MFS transporter [Gammaproteobacteria bacterium]|nr:MFS transporter [Gammaproteobacteria bacterium]
MSTIVVVKKAGQVCIAADSLTSFGDLLLGSEYDADHDKIIKNKNAHIGIVGSAAHQLVMESILADKKVKTDFSSKLAIFETFRSLHPVLKEKYFLNAKDEDDDPYESTQIDALIASKHGIFGVHSLREVSEYTRFWSIGSGSEYALGAMFAVYDDYGTAEEIAAAGVKAGAEFNTASAMPMSSYVIKLAKK